MHLCWFPAFLGGAPGPGELILLFVVVLVLFGPKRLPEIARMIGRTLEELRRASHDFKDQVMRIGTEVDPGTGPAEGEPAPGPGGEEDGNPPDKEPGDLAG